MAGVSSPSFQPPAVGRPRTTLLSPDLLFDGPSGTSVLPGTILMHLHDHSQRGKEPAIMRLATHPTGFEVKNVCDQALHGLHRLAPLLVEVLGSFLLEHFDHPLAFWTDRAPLAGRRQQPSPPLPTQLAKHILIIGLAVHEHGGNQALQLAGFQPHAFGFVGAVAHPLARPQHAMRTRYHTEGPMAIDPAVTLAVAPRGLCVQPFQARRHDPLLLVFAMPDRPTRPNQHLVSADDVIASSRVKKFDKCILHLFQARSRFFLNAPGADSRRWGAG